jgi:hypothetical protein
MRAHVEYGNENRIAPSIVSGVSGKSGNFGQTVQRAARPYSATRLTPFVGLL